MSERDIESKCFQLNPRFEWLIKLSFLLLFRTKLLYGHFLIKNFFWPGQYSKAFDIELVFRGFGTYSTHSWENSRHRQQYGLLRADGSHPLLWASVQVQVKHLSHVLRPQLWLFLELNETLDTLKSTEEDHTVLKASPLLECLKIDDIAFVWGAELEIVATLVRTLIKDGLKRVRHTNRVTPVGASLEEWLLLAHNLTCVVLCLLIKVRLIKLDCHTGAFL